MNKTEGEMISHPDQQQNGIIINGKIGVTTAYLEPGALTSPGLFLDRHDLQHLIFQTRTKEEVNDLRLLHGVGKRGNINYFIILH